MLFAIIFAAISVMLIWTTVRGRDAFPFSHYPMFSNLTSVSEVEVFRIALAASNNDVYWWKSEFYRYPEFVGRQLKKLYYAESDRTKEAFISLEKRRLFLEILRLIESEGVGSENLQALRVIKRTVSENNGDLSVNDEIIEVIEISRIRKDTP